MPTQTTTYVSATPSGGSRPRTALMKTYYDRKLLAYARTKFVHAKYGQKRHIPKDNGKRVEFRRWELFDPALASKGLTEGVTPASQDIGQTKVEAEVKQYGAYVEISDLLSRTAYDDVISDSAELLGEQLGTVLEWVTRDVMSSGNSVQYANSKTSRASLTATDVLTIDEIRKTVRTLKQNKARMFNGTENGGKARTPHFIAIVSPSSVFDLQNDEKWLAVSQYQDKENIYSGEIGRMFGVVFVESTEAKVFAGAGASSVDVHATLIFGKDAYGTIDLGDGSGAIKSIIKQLGSAGTADPLNQRATVGAKVMAYTAAILNQNWLIRIEHGVSA